MLLPVKTLVSTAKSPSGNSGINSPLSVESINNEMAKSATTKPITILGIAKEYPKFNILLLVYNKRLKKETQLLASSLDLKNLEIQSFHSYCYNYAEPSDKYPRPTTDFDLLFSILDSVFSY